jgi:phosphoribosylamine--glycine ligase
MGPETEVVVPRLKTDLVELFCATNEKLNEITLEIRSATTVMVVSGGILKSYEKEKVISGLKKYGFYCFSCGYETR